MKLRATVGVTCCAVLLNYLPKMEGEILRGYKDPIGIVTACVGHTKTAVLGRAYTPDQCKELLASDLIEHAIPVLKCTPGLDGQAYKLAAAISFTFNEGAHAYCTSGIARHFNAGDYVAACRSFNENDAGKRIWVTAGHPPRELPGLVKRRAIERALCEGRLV